MDLALNNLQRLICHKTKQTKPNQSGRVELASSRASTISIIISLFMLLIKEDTLEFDWGKGPKPYPEKRPVCHRFSTDALTERPEAAGCRNRHLLPELTPQNNLNTILCHNDDTKPCFYSLIWYWSSSSQ